MQKHGVGSVPGRGTRVGGATKVSLADSATLPLILEEQGTGCSGNKGGARDCLPWRGPRRCCNKISLSSLIGTERTRLCEKPLDVPTLYLLQS